MRTGKDRVQVDAMQVSVNIGQARVIPGDLLRGDADGVLVIRRSTNSACSIAAEEIAAIEDSIAMPCARARACARHASDFATTSFETRETDLRRCNRSIKKCYLA